MDIFCPPGLLVNNESFSFCNLYRERKLAEQLATTESYPIKDEKTGKIR